MATDHKYNVKTTKELGKVTPDKAPTAKPSGPTGIDGLPGKRTGTAAAARSAATRAAGKAK